MTRAWMQSLTGRAITMAAPQAAEIDPLVDLPEQLARICRYNGAVPGGQFSVAQHCALMADAILDETGDAELARIGLLHDAHEYVWGDITTPQVEGLDEIAVEMFDGSGLPVRAIIPAVIAEAKKRADAAIFRACGVPLPTVAQARAIKVWDLRMLATEKRQLLASCPRRWAAAVEKAEPIRMRGGMTLWSVARAADEYRRRLKQFCPALARRSSSERS